MRKQITNIQHLRGIAALLVVMSHLMAVYTRYGTATAAPAFSLPGSFGVDIFFIISGFIMFWTAGDAFGRDCAPRHFIVKRLIRIVPIYWLLTLLEAALLIIARHNEAGALTAFDGKLVQSMMFIPYLNAFGKYRPILGVGWSLNFEMLFYAIFALGLAFPRRIGLTVIGMVFCGLLVIGTMHPPGPARAWTSPIICEFLIGVGIAIFARYKSAWVGRVPGSPLPIAIVCIAFVSYRAPLESTLGLTWRPVEWLLAAVIVTACLVFRDSQDRTLIGRMLTRLGDSSYSLYLFHSFVIIQSTIALRKLGLFTRIPSPLYFTAMLTITVVSGYFFYRFVEKPLVALLNGWRAPRRAAPPADISMTSNV